MVYNHTKWLDKQGDIAEHKMKCILTIVFIDHYQHHPRFPTLGETINILILAKTSNMYKDEF